MFFNCLLIGFLFVNLCVLWMLFVFIGVSWVGEECFLVVFILKVIIFVLFLFLISFFFLLLFWFFLRDLVVVCDVVFIVEKFFGWLLLKFICFVINVFLLFFKCLYDFCFDIFFSVFCLCILSVCDRFENDLDFFLLIWVCEFFIKVGSIVLCFLVSGEFGGVRNGGWIDLFLFLDILMVGSLVFIRWMNFVCLVLRLLCFVLYLFLRVLYVDFNVFDFFWFVVRVFLEVLVKLDWCWFNFISNCIIYEEV